jgi:hypothetical protein
MIFVGVTSLLQFGALNRKADPFPDRSMARAVKSSGEAAARNGMAAPISAAQRMAGPGFVNAGGEAQELPVREVPVYSTQGDLK